MALILEGKSLALKKEESLKKKLENIKEKISFLIIQIGKDESTEVYVRQKIKKSEKLGFSPIYKNFDENSKEEEIINFIKEEQKKSDIYGVICEQPIPKKYNSLKIIESIDKEKDIDCLTPYNLGRLVWDNPIFYPATPKAVVDLLENYEISTEGKRVLIISRSIIIGKPLLLILLRKNKIGDATVIVAHSKTKELKELTKIADIIVTAVGKPNFLKADMVKEESVIIDCGINVIEKEGKSLIVGDACYEELLNKVKAITPVPGGVGVLTTINLLENLFLSYERKKGV
ncbi:MAG: bifunctional 5,10-methylenetetrahydrofolate dehydrogenase/5,10-methenyltetrahydrofolate cyclohydrolase [candidate division WOR-3 bacterium]|nr:bifunctional 5,10-methylenetetrahydrofolate dehydrogenase/5,10-methenyltetrahydrofolate cyclohydrolase [candidate division WOR-3 bacterium]MCX7836535.1 bifunctional 5,10-methylenetetrahydrofolate dehydrogenase/5,10-methenyltetrahydrofolate cyclohydrolase [candidate division WOR-3 bacterium]MDW8113773.1 bifunctional 5,10-methylenetetrahydrofolate dehydrogenase/5,10-methenyltetrahydrofolate cyclohydrolase [candidate division WOR-3 bacterium]